MATVTTIYGQQVTWTDGETTSVPNALTPRKEDDCITLRLDLTQRVLTFDLDVSRERFILACNVLLVNKWIKEGKPEDDRPKRMEA